MSASALLPDCVPQAPRPAGRSSSGGGWRLLPLLAPLLLQLHCAGPKSTVRPVMRPDEQRVTIYYPGEDLCEPYTDLGFVQGIAGQEPLPNHKVTEIATLEAALDWLRVATFARGGNSVLLLDRKQSDSQAVYVTTGIAMRCILTEDAADSSVGP
ncbi:MAG TPA: hypothetical protein PKI03_05665 [Pseudomonadota bacterium]|nr:hypothetical protein [Pseudomonadota bacterium]